MDIVSILMFGMATAMNVGILKFKLERGRYTDAALDFTILVVLAWLFAGTMTGLAIATVASAIISLYLMISPPDKLIAKLKADAKKSKKRKKRKKHKNKP